MSIDFRQDSLVTDQVCHVCGKGKVVKTTLERWQKVQFTRVGRFLSKFFTLATEEVSHRETHYHCNACTVTFSGMPPKIIEQPRPLAGMRQIAPGHFDSRKSTSILQ